MAAVAAPVVVGTLGALVFVGAELLGRTPPLAEAAPRNLSEAAGSASVPDVWRLLEAGHDPNRLYDVRPHIISSSILKATPAEAAIWSRRLELVKFLDTRGVLGDAPTRDRLACLARELGATDIHEYLLARSTPVCSGSVIQTIAARAR